MNDSLSVSSGSYSNLNNPAAPIDNAENSDQYVQFGNTKMSAPSAAGTSRKVSPAVKDFSSSILCLSWKQQLLTSSF